MPLAVAAGEALLAELSQVRRRVIARRQLKFRQVILAERELQLAAVGDALGVFHGLRIGGEKLLHLLGRADVEVLRLIAHAIFIVDGLARLDAQKHVVALRVLLAEVVRVVCTHKRDARLLMDTQQPAVHLRLIADAVILQLEVVIPLAEDLLHL